MFIDCCLERLKGSQSAPDSGRRTGLRQRKTCCVIHIECMDMSSNWKSMSTYAKTVRSHLYRGATAIAVFDDAQARGLEAYDETSRSLRQRIESELIAGSLLIEDICAERSPEIPQPDICALCGRRLPPLTRDHLWAKSRGGKGGDNFIWVCHPCNSDKKNMDLFEWIECTAGRKKPVPIWACRRYLFNAWSYCKTRGLLDKQVKKAGSLPFKLRSIPSELPLR